MTVRLLLFGSPMVEYGGKSLALPFERRHQLLVFLALKKVWVGRTELAAMFWPEQESKLAYTNLRKTLHRLQSLPWTSNIESQRGALRFEAETDVDLFESALREQRLAEALPMRRGELLAGFNDDQSDAWSSWLSFERDRLRLAWRDAALNHLNNDIEITDAVELSARLLESDPLDESALRAHLSWLTRSGHTAHARQIYREFVERLDNELGLTPSAELQALHDSLATTARIAIAPPPAALPKIDTDFVGRTVELRRIANLMAQDDCRLLTVLGPGGAGKTRLARRALAEIAQSFVDGAIFVPLEDVTSLSEIGGRLACDLNIQLAGNEEPLTQVIEFVRARQMLFVLDNFEHLAADSSVLRSLLDACPRLKIIVTSRIRLTLPGEWLMSLEGLPCPDIEDEDNLEAFDAVRLFVQAARRVEPALVASVEAASIVDICQQVEGLPLALELAAAWTRVLSCDAIAAELRQGTELLRATDGTQPARHASIDTVFEQSWRLLSSIERSALARLSVFRGGFTAEAARAVAAASLPVLGALTDKSLLRKDSTRLFMHPLVHQLAALRLADTEARETAERAHAMHFGRLMTQLRRTIENGDRDALQQIDTEYENCRAAWRWSIGNGAGDALMKSAPTMFYFCEHRGRFKEGLSLLTDAMESNAARKDPKLNVMLLSQWAHLQYRLDHYPEAEAAAARALKAAKIARDHSAQTQALQVLGSCCLRTGRQAESMRYFQQAVRHALVASDPRKAGVNLHNQAVVARAMGRLDEAQRLFVETMTRHKAVGDIPGEALCLTNLSLVLAEKGEIESAIAHLKTALSLCERHGFLHTKALVLTNLTGLAATTGDLVAADAYGRQAAELAEAVGNRNIISWLKLQFARAALARSDIDAAQSELESSLSLAVTIGRPSLLLAGILCFAEVLAARGEGECARLVVRFASRHPLVSPSECENVLKRLPQLSEDNANLVWPGFELDELVHRILTERDVAQAPLIAALRGELVH